MNLGEEVNLTVLWQSGASESSATVCFVISLICYWLLKCGVLHVVCVCVCARRGTITGFKVYHGLEKSRFQNH